MDGETHTFNENGEEKHGLAELTRDQYTVGWVCALTEELNTAPVMLDRAHETLSDFEFSAADNNLYSFGSNGI